MAGLTLHAYAKINLGLEITRRRTDGYHDVVTILQALEFGDTIQVRRGVRKERLDLLDRYYAAQRNAAR